MENNMRKEMEEKEKQDFKVLGLSSFIYAVVLTFCLYKNFSGITNVLWTVATVIYIAYVARKYEKKQKPINIFYDCVIILLGISNFTTDNQIILFFNYMVIFIAIAVNMIYMFIDIKKLGMCIQSMAVCQCILGCIGELPKPFTHGIKALKMDKDRNNNIKYILIGIGCALPVVMMVTIILASADSVFRNMIVKIFKLDTLILNLTGIVIMIIVSYALVYAFSFYVKNGKVYINEKENKMAALPVNIIMSMVAVVYVMFATIQVVYLFGHGGSLPQGYTYAQYARQGFFQLLFLSGVNVVFILLTMEFVKINKFMKVVSGVICLCTFIMIFSSGYRMKMYIEEYGLTFSRIFVLWLLVVIGMVMLGLVIKNFHKELNLFSFSMVVVICCFIVLSFSHVDYIIAKYNLSQCQYIMDKNKNDDPYEINIYVDMDYIINLSADSVPAVLDEKNEKVTRYLNKKRYYKKLEKYKDGGIRSFNLSRYNAGKNVK